MPRAQLVSSASSVIGKRAQSALLKDLPRNATGKILKELRTVMSR
ncbi:hypothetical protein FHX38_0490 [Kocuria rosea]|nr:hypothetical protein FHX38_0490 [Kocuria rosea]